MSAVTNLAFQQAIPHGMVIIDSLPKVVSFGIPDGFLQAIPGVGPRSPFWDHSRGRWGALREHFQGSNSNPSKAHAERKPKRGFQPKRTLGLYPEFGSSNSDSNENSAS